MNTFKKIIQLLSKKERRRGYLLLFMILFMALLDTIGVASIIPFMAVLGNPEIVKTNPWLSKAYDWMNFTDPNEFLFFLGILVFVALVLSIAFKALTQWAMLRFKYMRVHSLSCRFLKGYLGRPYPWFLNQHSASLGKKVLTEVNLVVHNVIAPAMSLIAHGTVALFLIILLFVLDPVLALLILSIFGGSYLFLYVMIRRYLTRIGKDRVLSNRERFKIAQEALGGIKEIKIFGREQAFFSQYTNPSFRFARHQANSQMVGLLPRHLLEILAFGGILLLAIFLFRAHERFSLILPVLGVYAFAGYRLMPALQNVYRELVQLRFGSPALDALHENFLEFRENQNVKREPSAQPLFPRSAIILKDVNFTYPQAVVPILKSLNMEISINTMVGLVGGTGSGKTTTVDIILGLLTPDRGNLFVDDHPINRENVRLWQKALGYVPQHIYLIDDTVAANIAFGVPPAHIDLDAVKKAAIIAGIHDFVVQEMPYGYDTFVGERGIRLSGGQRQRIGIARALYNEPKVLVFDEATSALDNVTEKYVMQSIKRMKEKRTIILVAHRLSTVSNCDVIYLLDNGVVKARGTYDELIAKSGQFRKMAEGTISKVIINKR